MRAQRARAWCRWIRHKQAVKSYEGERPAVDPSVGADEFPGHEPHVRMEPLPSAGAGRRVRTGSSQDEIRLSDDTIEVEDQRGISTCGVSGGRFRVSGRR